MIKDALIEKMSVKDLIEAKARIEKEIISRKDSERQDLKDKMKALASEHGYSINELFGGKVGRKGAAGGTVKYVHPDNPSMTWSGRGRMPKWLSEIKKSGKSIEGYLAR